MRILYLKQVGISTNICMKDERHDAVYIHDEEIGKRQATRTPQKLQEKI